MPPPARILAACVLFAAAALAGAAPAGAAFPGRDGMLAYEGKLPGQLYLRQADGRWLRRLLLPGRPRDPAFSPQGRRLVYAIGDGNLGVSLLDGSPPIPIVTHVRPSRHPTWSPGGDRVAFAGGRTGARELFSIVTDGSDLTQLSFSPADEYDPAWSSRGQIALVYSLRDRNAGDIAVMSGTGGRVRRLTRGRADDESPAWSPGGGWITFARTLQGHTDLYVVRADGRRLRRVVRMSAAIHAPAFSPDGRRIAFAAGRWGHRSLYLVATNGRELRRVAGAGNDPRAIDWQPNGSDPVVAAAGDIACDPGSVSFVGGQGTDAFCHELATSNLLLRHDLASVLVLGDSQYEDGAYPKFVQSFGPSWGRFKSIERPTVGNHEFLTPGAAGYFDYFDGVGKSSGPAGPRGLGYYSFDIGRWHLISLNSECTDASGAQLCAPGSPQEQWLRADLAAHPARCTLAFWHRPLVSSGIRAVNASVAPLWQDLYDAGADLVLTGHDHAYERFAPMTASLAGDPARGLREFVVGTGGKDYQGTLPIAQPNSEFRAGPVYGVLELALHPTSYDWAFVTDDGATIDSGHTACH